MSTNQQDPQLREAEEAVRKLYEFRDTYFDRQPIAKAHGKAKDISLELDKTLALLSKLQQSCEQSNKALFYMLKGKALNIRPNYDEQAFQCLTRAIKLNPKSVDTWNELGECYWKKENFEEAKNSFLRGLEREKNKVSLRNLSMVLRQQGKTPEEKRDAVKESLEKAKEATELDMNDGVSWTVLGNAYLTSFFTVAQTPDMLKKCLAAYQRAEQDSIAKNSTDLHFNRAVALQYEEEYEAALSGYSTAAALDPSWDLPRNKEAEVVSYLKKVQDFIVKKGGMKQKRLRTMISAINPSQLGPYADGSYTSKTGKGVIKLQQVNLADLTPGWNEEKVLLGKIVSFIYADNNVPMTLCLVDKSEGYYAVNVYNLSGGWLLCIGDSVAIPEPYLTEVNFEYKSNKFNYKSIRVVIPLVLVVNGKKLGKESVASVEVSVTNMTL